MQIIEKQNLRSPFRRSLHEGIKSIFIDPELIDTLKLLIPMSRSERRMLARKEKIIWENYKLVEFELLRRKHLGLDLSTGKEKS